MRIPHARHAVDRVQLPLRLGRANPMVLYYILAERLFWAGCSLWMLLSLSRLATGVKTQARMKALKSMPDAFTEEERADLIRKTKSRLLGPL